MKKILSFFMLTMLTAGFSAKAADEIYAVWDESSTTLTLRYDAEREAQGGVTDWSAYKATATTVVFDASMQNARPTGTKEWFRSFEKLTAIQHLDYLNTSEVTDMSYMFCGCKALTSLDISNFNTEKVTDMSYMFDECKALTSFTLGSSFSTANVTTMSSMFSNCNALTSLDLSNFNTANVEYMDCMFSGCQALTSLDLSKFNTEKVTDMYAMFGWCNALTALDFSKFNTEKVTDMSWMFYDCRALTTLTLGSSFSTDNVTDMSYMFSNCEQLTSLDISKFNTEKVTSMEFMFSNCYALTALDFSSFSTANVTTMQCMFHNCNALNSLDLSNFSTEKVANVNTMFWSCKALTTIYWDVDLSGRTDINSGSMFSDCDKLVGGNGTEYDNNITDNTYARPDGKDGKPGYFTTKPVPQTKEMTPTIAYLDWDNTHSVWGLTVYEFDALENPLFIFTLNAEGSKISIPTSLVISGSTDDNMVFSDGENTWYGIIKDAAFTISYDGGLRTKEAGGSTVLYALAKISGEMSSEAGDKLIVKEPADFIECYVTGIDIPTGIDNAQAAAAQTTKLLRNGSLYILRNGKTYTITGAEVIR
ncbi:MAG: BspA family leucine-rich repeat surface protein [Paludibacteraceae bacterium]|nr:BspA family leucine-rich repeat surface protein [Paludibacteraceae bacterium]